MKKRSSINFLIILVVITGLLAGWSSFSWLHLTAQCVSAIFLRLLKLISLPMIFFAITSTLSGMRDLLEVRTIGRRILQYTLITTLLAATVALVLYLFIDPAQSVVSLRNTSFTLEHPSQPSYLSFLITAIPDNFVQAFAQGHVIGIVLIAICLGIATVLLPSEQKQTLHHFFSSFFAVLLKLTKGIIACMPFAIWAFIVVLIKDLKQDTSQMRTLGWYLVCVIGANLLQGVIVLPILLKAKKISVMQLFKAVIPAISMAFFSKSSNATLPLTMQRMEQAAGVSKKTSQFSLPLCTVINMNGCAAFILITTLFVATLSGHVFGLFDYIAWIFIATLAAIGNAGVPMGCYFLTSACLVGMNVPLYMMGLILPFYTIIDMIETALNVWSDVCVTKIVEQDLQSELSVEQSQSVV